MSKKIKNEGIGGSVESAGLGVARAVAAPWWFGFGLILLSSLSIASAAEISPTAQNANIPSDSATVRQEPVASRANPLLKCNDQAKDQEQFKFEIMKSVNASRSGLKPAAVFNAQTAQNASEAAKEAAVQKRLEQQAGRLAKALFAAMQKPSNPADAVSEGLFGRPDRRMSIRFHAQCGSSDSGVDAKPKLVMENSDFFSNNASCADGERAKSVDVETTQVLQTGLSEREALNAALRLRVSLHGGVETSVCRGSHVACSQPEAFKKIDPMTLDPVKEQNLHIQQSEQIAFWTMSSREAVQVHRVPVCGREVFLVSSLAQSHSYGYDRSTRLDLISQVGDRTVMVVDQASQTWDAEAFPLQAPEHPNELKAAYFGQGRTGKGDYADIAQAIGSRERLQMGMVGKAAASPQIASGSPTAPAIQ
jgi:hypothetical protein